LNLLKAGHSVTVWNRTTSRASELVQPERSWRKPPEAAAASDILFTIVSDPPALEEILWDTRKRGRGAGRLAFRKRLRRFQHNSPVMRGGFRRRAASATCDFWTRQ